VEAEVQRCERDARQAAANLPLDYRAQLLPHAEDTLTSRGKI